MKLKVGDYVREVDGNAVGIIVHIMRNVVVVNWPPSQHGHAFHPSDLVKVPAMNTIESWSLSDGERREIARKYCARIVDVRINNSISEMPSDAWLNAELHERGREAIRVVANLRERRAPRMVAHPRDDFAGAMDGAPVLQDRRDRQREVLHRALGHGAHSAAEFDRMLGVDRSIRVSDLGDGADHETERQE